MATLLNNMGTAQMGMGDRDAGLANLHKASEIRDAVLPPNHPLIASLSSTMAQTYYDAKDYSMAQSFYEKALNIRLKSSPSDDANLATAYYDMSRVMEKTKEAKQAVRYAELAVQTADWLPSDTDPHLPDFREHLNRLRQK